jgi:hypothetical protein
MIKVKRQIRIDGKVAYIPLTKGYEAIIDADDVPLVCQFNWCAMVRKHVIYARRGDYSSEKQRTELLHRVIMGNPVGLFIDHIDGNQSNNLISNLRAVTYAENSRNMPIRSNNKSGCTGVVWSKKYQKWIASIGVRGRHVYLGSYNEKDLAVAARLEANKAYGFHENHGRVARG